MKPRRMVLTCVFGIWLAAILQISVAPRLALHGFHPDFLLVVLTPISLVTSRPSAAAAGFCCGLVQGALAGANLTHYAATRAIAGFAGSWSRAIGFELNIPFVAATAFLMTLLSQILWMFLAAPQGVATFLGDTIGAAVYNGLLAIPAYLLLKRILKPRARSGL